MAGQPWAWAPVGAWKLASNQARVGAPKRSSGDSAITGHGTGGLRRLLPAVPVRDLLDRSPSRGLELVAFRIGDRDQRGLRDRVGDAEQFGGLALVREVQRRE